MKIYKHELLLSIAFILIIILGLTLWYYFPAMMAVASIIIALYIFIKYLFSKQV